LARAGVEAVERGLGAPGDVETIRRSLADFKAKMAAA